MAADDSSAEYRDETAESRDRAAELRDHNAGSRDAIAATRSKDAERRDEQAERRDQEAELRDETALHSEAWRGQPSQPGMLSRAAAARREAASDRRLSRRDRERAAADRDNADLDRYESESDRVASAGERTLASLDALTGAYLRGPGLLELERDFARASRTDLPFALAFIDIDRLKAVNDAGGHAAGDKLLRRVAAALKAQLRSYDIIVRFGGDEFVCGLAGLDLTGAAARMKFVHDAMDKSPEIGSITVGLAEMRPEDSLERVIERADSALYRQRQRSHKHGSGHR